MATPDQIPTDLTIDLGDGLAPDEFIAAVRNFFGYVNEITEAQKGDGAEISWTVKVKEGSSLVGVEPNIEAPESRLTMIYEKIKFATNKLASGNLKEAGLPEKAIGYLKKLSELSEQINIKIWIKKKPISINSGIAKIIFESSESDYYDYGTLEGRLDTIQDASGSIKIKIKDFLYPKPINCVVPETMIDKVLSSFRKRVEIEGKIHYRKDGTPISIEAEHIDVLPEDSELPSASDVRGIMAS